MMNTINVADEHKLTITIPTSIVLDLAPELAILSLLEATLQVAIRALAAAHPEIGTIDDPLNHQPNAPLFPSASACTADSIINHLDAVCFGILSYRRSRTRELAITTPPPPPPYPDDQDIPF